MPQNAKEMPFLFPFFLLGTFHVETIASDVNSTLAFLPCDNITLTFHSTFSDVSRIECSAQCLTTEGCFAFRFKDNICDVEVEGLPSETTVFAQDGCFATKGV